MHRAPLLVPALGFLAGIVLEAHAAIFVLGSLAVALVCMRRDAALAFVCGALIGHVLGHPAVITREYPSARYVGTIVGDVRANDDGLTTFPLAVAGIGTLRATAFSSVHAGERIALRGRVTPFDEPRNPGEPSARTIGIDEGLVGELHVGAVLRRQPPDIHDARVWMPLARAWSSVIVRRFMPEPDASVLAGALWGERSTLPHAIRDDFQATGTVHVLVTAGLHLGVIAALIAWLCGALGLGRVTTTVVTLPIVIAYACFSGGHLPSERAAVMIGVALIARACGARAVSLNTLAIGAIVVAAAWPVAVESVSFALSFSCVASIVLFADGFAAWFRARRLPEWLADALALTTSTQIGVWPLTAATFFSVAPFAIFANALVVPLIGAIMLGGIAIIAAHAWVPFAAIVARWDDWLIAIAISVIHAIAQLPEARLSIAPPPSWALIGYDLVVVVAAIVMPRHPRAALAGLGIACIVVFSSSLPHAPGAPTITMLDVGQGDGIVVRTPRGHTIMFDTGGRLERGATIDGSSPAERSADRIVLPYLIRAGITHIDLLVLTHPHGDHVGGFAGIVRTLRVDQIFDSGQVYGGRAFNDGMHEAALKHVPVHIARCGDRWSSDDGVQIDVLSPCGALLADGKNDVNENSIVAMLSNGSFRMLFTGDAGFETERRLLARGIDLHADVLKIGHHGSAYATSPEFIAAVHPRLAFISVGRHNLFGHPARSTIETIEAAGVNVYRTDTCGAITISIATKLHLSTMLACDRGLLPR